ncbi:sigma factor [Sphingomonas sp. dw_22]|uniref:sigma factor n=1 Tax=Sphingomonas sp. dw_22 TaxID=2721175 RepID=UPI001BD2CE07|nr:sigma factor [Sphingomonas sp. dw_22]
MIAHRNSISIWVAHEILPHEGAARSWLARRWGNTIDVDDVIQETCCRLSALKSISHIVSPKAYFLRTLHSVAVDMVR